MLPHVQAILPSYMIQPPTELRFCADLKKLLLSNTYQLLHVAADAGQALVVRLSSSWAAAVSLSHLQSCSTGMAHSSLCHVAKVMHLQARHEQGHSPLIC